MNKNKQKLMIIMINTSPLIHQRVRHNASGPRGRGHAERLAPPLTLPGGWKIAGTPLGAVGGLPGPPQEEEGLGKQDGIVLKVLVGRHRGRVAAQNGHTRILQVERSAVEVVGGEEHVLRPGREEGCLFTVDDGPEARLQVLGRSFAVGGRDRDQEEGPRRRLWVCQDEELVRLEGDVDVLVQAEARVVGQLEVPEDQRVILHPPDDVPEEAGVWSGDGHPDGDGVRDAEGVVQTPAVSRATDPPRSPRGVVCGLLSTQTYPVEEEDVVV